MRTGTYSNLLASFSSAVGILEKRVTAFVSPSAFFPVRSPDMLQRESCYLKKEPETREPTEEEMEAYRMKRQRPDDPMASFLGQ